MPDSKKYINREGWLSIFGNLFLFGLKYWAGIVTGSLALIADAWHTLSDSVSSVIVLVGGKISRKPADDDHPFGHGRAEHVAAVIIGVLLAIVAFDFAVSAVDKFSKGEQTVFGIFAWVATIVSILAKEGMAQYAFWAAKKTNSSILKADGWHHRSDAFSSVVILVGIAVGNYFWWTDAVLSFIVAMMIGYVSYKILSKEITSLLGERPSDEMLLSIRETTQKAFEEPLHLHHIHLHNYGNHTELSCHIKLPPDMPLDEAHEICTKVENVIFDKFGFVSTVHPEPIEW
ncbi:cation diffusion facilitator family transporter [Tangfeifania diversioriginum]|uniref:Cation diffusion facilitator family transporter n=1 Tax=Tangfeifania diversioriginum TaxID=1168035 RepID=A0A1M6A520_9BACT|nr:cation diffusion facilitator family transporter [Tangfeifania diversioriginum]SHI31576.1 cation diffusion facilitator family transporter [Tangfeifania diversioriginum]